MGEAPAGWTEVVVADNDYHAHLLRGALEDEGIRVVLEPFATGAGAYLHPGGDPSAPVRILIPIEQASGARDVLAAFDAEAGTVEASEFPDDPDEVPIDVPEISNDVFAERRAGIPLRILVAAAVVVAIVLGLTISSLGPLDL